MREHLYRGKAINRDPNWTYRTEYKNGDWVFGLVSKLDKYGAEMTNEDGVSRIDVDPETIEEYAGIPDKNGKKIFEGDILSGLFNFELPINGVVIFQDGAFGIKARACGAERFTAFTSFCNVTFEIVGNIHDNPELLEGKNG